MKIAVRGYCGGVRVFEEIVDADLDDRAMAQRHIDRVVHHPRHMIEIEFLDEPDPMQRFLRFGSDTSMMVAPQKVGP